MKNILLIALLAALPALASGQSSHGNGTPNGGGNGLCEGGGNGHPKDDGGGNGGTCGGGNGRPKLKTGRGHENMARGGTIGR